MKTTLTLCLLFAAAFAAAGCATHTDPLPPPPAAPAASVPGAPTTNAAHIQQRSNHGTGQ